MHSLPVVFGVRSPKQKPLGKSLAYQPTILGIMGCLVCLDILSVAGDIMVDWFAGLVLDDNPPPPSLDE